MEKLPLDTALTMSKQRNNKISSHWVTVQLGRPAGRADAGAANVETVHVGSGLYIHFKANGTLQGQL